MPYIQQIFRAETGAEMGAMHPKWEEYLQQKGEHRGGERASEIIGKIRVDGGLRRGAENRRGNCDNITAEV